MRWAAISTIFSASQMVISASRSAMSPAKDLGAARAVRAYHRDCERQSSVPPSVLRGTLRDAVLRGFRSCNPDLKVYQCGPQPSAGKTGGFENRMAGNRWRAGRPVPVLALHRGYGDARPRRCAGGLYGRHCGSARRSWRGMGREPAAADLEEAGDETAAQLNAGIWNAVDRFTARAGQRDDMTLLVLRAV
jgi:hypothetical protein